MHQRHAAVAGDPRQRLPRRLLQRPGPSRAFPRKRPHARPRPQTAQAPRDHRLDHDQPGDLDPADQASLDAILARPPELATVAAHARSFAAIMVGRRGRNLEQWMTSALATGEPALRSFVTGLQADQDAVTAGLTLRWNSGSVEGHVNRIKMLKRQMYGRANPNLLRLRILLAD